MVHRFNAATATALQGLPPSVTALTLPHLPGASAALMVLSLAQLYPESLILTITASTTEQEAINGDLHTIDHNLKRPIALLAPTENENDPEDQESLGERLLAAQTIQQTPPDTPPPIVVAAVHALQQRIPNPTAIAAATTTLTLNSETPLVALIAKLSQAGYERRTEVDEKGIFAVRGGILDIWSPTAPLPLRAEFVGDMVDSLRRFDPSTQTSVEKITNADIPPCQTTSTIWPTAILPPNLVILSLEHDRITQFANTRALEHPNTPDWPALATRLSRHQPRLHLYSGDPPPPALPALPLPIAPVAGLAGITTNDPSTAHPDLIEAMRRKLIAPLADISATGALALLCADTPGTCEMLSHDLPAGASIPIIRLPLSGGFTLDSTPSHALTIMAQADLYALRKQAPRRSRKNPAGQRFETIADIQPGDRVVHSDYGIGRYIGTTEVEIDNTRREVITLEYADNTRLHVPTTHLHLLSRYVGVGKHAAPLHRLGGKRWSREKTAAESAIADLAASLLDTQAKRQLIPGYSFNTSPPWMHTFEASFPYQETPDQTKIIAEIKADMAAPRPMDRLICGDAGYGKTEIAIRAAFIAVMNHRQVAVLVPTTVLAEQHFDTFRERMAPYPIKIAVLSRFRSIGQRQATLRELATGEVDIVIGTHALLQPTIAFKDLGLLIIDEEQRFGVRHKEYLKTMRQVVDVLTLSATPIPRTLYLSMTGARDMSLLQTPPRERLSIETKVVRDSDATIRTAIKQELARDGQIFYLYNRVITLPIILARLERLTPEARIAVAHGQMPAQELATIMRDFENGLYDILLCTTIIESGLDIPRANTIIVDRADRFGIADLYQLRGRVGRSSRKGYAWLLLPDHGMVDDDARQRISALRAHSGLGAGFALALRDLEIRGGGAILGAAQSGHIAAIGFSLYCQLLKRTVARLKGEPVPTLIDVNLSLDFIDSSPGAFDPQNAACIPYDYIDDDQHRLTFYRRMAEISTRSDAAKLQTELADRYGHPPLPVIRLLRLAELRVAAAQNNINRIEVHQTAARLYHPDNPHPLLLGTRLPRLTATTADKKIAQLIKLAQKLTKS